MGRCLPVYLSGCSRLVVLAGTTYLSRLWCIIELFTFVHMGGQVSNIDVLPLLRHERREEDRRALATAIATFGAGSCECHNPEDKETMLVMIKTAFSDMEAFNAVVRSILGKFGHEFCLPFAALAYPTCGTSMLPGSVHGVLALD